jgi:GTPase SAR1 family protein
VEEFVYKGVTMSVWDTGGQVIHKLADCKPFLSLLSLYLSKCQHSIDSKDIKAIIFVVDAHDSSLIPFAQEILHSIVSSDGLQDAPVLVLANKQDLSGALNESELITALRLFDLKSSLWHVQVR